MSIFIHQNVIIISFPQNKASYFHCSNLELLLEVAVQHSVQDGVGHGGCHAYQVAEKVGKHHVPWGEINHVKVSDRQLKLKHRIF